MKSIKNKLMPFAFAALFIGLAHLAEGSQTSYDKEQAFFPKFTKEAVSTQENIREALPPDWPRTGIQIFPEAGRKAWADAINSAKSSIQMSAYKLSDPAIIEALVKARKEKNIAVNLLIQPEVYSHEQSLNVASPINGLRENGINVFQPSVRFSQVHYKMIIIDEKWGMVSSGNLDAESFDGVPTISPAPCRDFAITITNPHMIKELARIFNADAADKRVVPEHPQLVWGPDQQRSVFLEMINSAKESIRIYQQDIQDVGITQALVGAAKAKVKVEIIMMPFPFSKKEDKNTPNQRLIEEAGGRVYLHNKHYIHAKLMIIDNRLMYIGSCNFYTPSLDQTRELGVLTFDDAQIKQVNETFEKDLLQAAAKDFKK